MWQYIWSAIFLCFVLVVFPLGVPENILFGRITQQKNAAIIFMTFLLFVTFSRHYSCFEIHL